MQFPTTFVGDGACPVRDNRNEECFNTDGARPVPTKKTTYQIRNSNYYKLFIFHSLNNNESYFSNCEFLLNNSANFAQAGKTQVECQKVRGVGIL